VFPIFQFVKIFMISVSKLSFDYTANTSIVFPDFQVPKGEHFLLLGESGSGKTTLLYLLGGLLRNYKGSVMVKDVELGTLTEPSLDKFRALNLGFIFQRNHLITALTVEQNLMMPFYLANKPIHADRIQEVLSSLRMEEKRKSKISELSQGQAQRVAIARAVVNKPAIILADEPTSALDDKNCANVMSLLMEVANKNQSTLIIATHDQRLKNMVQRKIILN
jgi:ABC-type lipoprotein export system ATPase subunit